MLSGRVSSREGKTNKPAGLLGVLIGDAGVFS